MAAPPPAKPNGIGARLTAKVGPLPVWAWALVLLIGGYLAYRLIGGSSSSTPAAAPSGASSDAGSSADADTSAGGSDGAPPASGFGASSDSSDLAGYLSGLQGSVDSLTSAVQMSPAFWPTSGDAGSGAFIPNDGSLYSSGGATASGTTPKATSVAASSPKTTAAKTAPTATIRYYTYAPGKAPASRKGDEAPARGPAGTTLHFATGKGYYYA